MQRDQLKSTLNTLHETLSHESEMDPELKDLLETLDADIHELLAEAPAPAETSSLMDAAETLAARFAADHPRAEPIVREIVAILGRMGV